MSDKRDEIMEKLRKFIRYAESGLFAARARGEIGREELDSGLIFRDEIRALIEEHGKLKEENIVLLERIENLKHSLEELAKENYKLKEGDDEW